MKTYQIQPSEVSVADFTMFALSLGERGRGRKLTNLACPENFEFLEPGQTRSGKPRLIKSNSAKGWVARISTSGAYIRGANGNVSVPLEFKDKVKMLARGQGAFGAAGRTGNWDDVVIATELEDFWVRVKPSRGDAYLLKFSPEKAHKISYEDADLLDMDLCDSTPTSRGNLIRL